MSFTALLVLDLFFVQTFADISLVKSCHMCDLQHHGTDLFGPFMWDFP